MDVYVMILAIIIGSGLSLAIAAVVFLKSKSKNKLIAATLPLGAGALLAASIFDLLPEAIEQADAHAMLTWFAIGFLAFFLLERLAPGFHHHHEHDDAVQPGKHEQQNRFMVTSDLVHNCIDGVAIGAAFLVSVPTGIITVLAVSLHEIPKELGTFGILISRGWKDTKAIIANILTAIGTLASAVLVYSLAADFESLLPPILALTAGFFLYIAASDIIPDIHEQPRRRGSWQALILVLTVALSAVLIHVLHEYLLHAH